MKHYKILKSFLGSQDGLSPAESFHEGTVATLSDDLAAVVVKEGWAEPVKAPAAENRETKVEAPAETKPAAKKGKK